MCGVVGVHQFDGSGVEPALLKRMTEPIAHRGPDGEGYWVSGNVGFGHRRLSIIGIADSAQPMSTHDGRFHICFNGEIFNYRELRADLDYPFRTNGDTEVLLALFAAQGVAGLSRLRGQFAFGVHDSVTGDSWLVRDRLGVLPLYYIADARRLAFASEIKALRPLLLSPPSADMGQLAHYLMRRAVPSPGTLFEGVHKVPPGHFVHVSQEGVPRTERYWSPPGPSELMRLQDDEAVDLVEGQLRAAVGDALVADVPVGSYLSGGVDSSLVVAIASSLTAPHPLETFSASFGDPRFDETAHAQTVSRLFRTRHHEVPVHATDFEELWPELTWHRDAPLSEPADIAVFRLAQAARHHVKVVLSGEGSDELFGGYPKYRYATLTVKGQHLPATIRRGLRGIERALPARANKLRIAVRAQAAPSAEERIATWFAPFTSYECEQLLGVPVSRAAGPSLARDPIDLMGRFDLVSWLPDNLLERGDRMSMAASLELRPPFLDHRLVETAFRLAPDLKLRGRQTKWVLKQVAKRHLPDSIVERRKVGFRVPLDEWFRGGLRSLTNDLLLGSDSFVLSAMDGRAIARLVRDHERGRRNEEIRIWTLLSLEVWARNVLRDGSTAGSKPVRLRETCSRPARPT